MYSVCPAPEVARTLAIRRLSRSNAVTIYEVGVHEGQLILATEFVKGRDWRAWLSERRQSLPCTPTLVAVT